MAKIKELTIHRSKKYAWDYGNGVGYNIGMTIEGDESDILDMKRMAYEELNILEAKEQERCRDVAEGEKALREIKEIESTPVVEKKEKPLPKLPRDTPKIDTSKVYKISGKECENCGGKISWELRPKRHLPLHVDAKGHQLGTGDCPGW